MVEKVMGKEFEKFLKNTILKAGIATLKYHKNPNILYTKRNKTDIVTKADIASHQIITRAIKKTFPSHGIISEEDKEYKSGAEYVWVIDPVDGTRNFSKKGSYGIMIALMKDKEITMGVIYYPVTKELLFASKNKGAYLNNKQVKCSSFETFSNSYGIDDSWGDRLLFSSSTYEKINVWYNRNNCVGISVLEVARGKRDWFIFTGSKGLWDYAAPAIILQEAGCTVTNFSGKAWTINDRDIIAANKMLNRDILRNIVR